MATKIKTAWFCNNCGAESPKWMGRCPACGEWNTMVEEKVLPEKRTRSGLSKTLNANGRRQSKPIAVTEIEAGAEQRIKMPSSELNRVLGGGLVCGSLVLIGGEPGIGKSTLVLQNVLCMRGRNVLYVSGEESAQQIKMRADRIGHTADNIFVACETSLENIIAHVEALNPSLLVVDSIQTIASDELDAAAGSVSQVRECAARLLRLAKETGIPVILIGHITKEGAIAGPKVLEHIVDAVLQFEGDRQYMYRILRAIKNRFGSTNELGIYEMIQRGLREVTNPGEMLLSNADESLSGISTGITLEGVRPFLIEAQALVSTAAYGTPQRSVTGFDPRRMNMLLAVLEKRVGFKLGQKDVFLNIAGGLKVNDPALDLAVIAAIISSNIDIPVSRKTCVVGEVGLSGEIRPAIRMEQRLIEAHKMGMERIIIAPNALKGVDRSRFKLDIIETAKVEDAVKALFG